MHNLKKSLLVCGLLLVAFSTISTPVFALSEQMQALDQDLNYRSRDNQNSKAHFTPTIIVSEIIELNPQAELDYFLFYTSESSLKSSLEQYSENTVFSSYFQDKRDLLKNQIFPFHFFW